MYLYSSFSIEKGISLIITTENTAHKYSLLSSNKDTYSHAWGFSAGTTSVLLTREVFLFFCVLDRINRECLIICDGKFSLHWSFHWDLLNLHSRYVLIFPNSSSKNLTKRKWPHQGRIFPEPPPQLPQMLNKLCRESGATDAHLLHPNFLIERRRRSAFPTLLPWEQRPTSTRPDCPLKVSSSICSLIFRSSWISNGRRRFVNARRLL